MLEEWTKEQIKELKEVYKLSGDVLTHDAQIKYDFLNALEIIEAQQKEIEQLKEQAKSCCGICITRNNMKCPKMPIERIKGE